MKLAAFAAALLLSASALAQYPTRPITMVVPFPPGGATDITARTVGQKLSEVLGQTVVVDNKPGANGSIGAAFVARAPADGYTLLVGSIGVFAINPVLYKDLGYDPRRDFDLLSVAVRTPNALVTTANFPASNVHELVDYMKKNPDRVSFASSGTGSSDHLTAALFWQQTGTMGLHVPYKGGSPAQMDVIAGNANASFQNLGAISNYVKAGKMKLLAITADKRDPMFANTPTMKEAGVNGVEVFSWQAIAGPKGLPKDVKAKLEAALATVYKDPTIVKRLNDIGFEVVGNSSAQFATFLDGELARWKQVVDKGGIKQTD